MKPTVTIEQKHKESIVRYCKKYDVSEEQVVREALRLFLAVRNEEDLTGGKAKYVIGTGTTQHERDLNLLLPY